MRAPAAIAVLLLASCTRQSYRLIRVEPQLRLVPPKGVPVARAPTPADAHRARYGPYVQNGFVDLRAGMVLKAVTPVLPAGETLSNEIADSKPGEVTVRSNVIGFATAFYGVEAAGDKVSLRFRSGEQSIRGVRPRLPRRRFRSTVARPTGGSSFWCASPAMTATSRWSRRLRPPRSTALPAASPECRA